MTSSFFVFALYAMLLPHIGHKPFHVVAIDAGHGGADEGAGGELLVAICCVPNALCDKRCRNAPVTSGDWKPWRRWECPPALKVLAAVT